MSEVEKVDLLRMRQVFPSGPPMSFNPLSRLLPHLVPEEGDCNDSDAPFPPGEDNRSVDSVGYPEPTILGMEHMEATAVASGVGTPDGDDAEMAADEYSHHLGPILTDEESEAQVQAAARRSRMGTDG
eukprot:2689831-Pyramimonas_sp.AAC.1